MCHVVLLLPIFGLVLFWFLDFSLALPLYIGLVVLSSVVALLMLQSLRKPARSGMEGMRGATAEVVEALRPHGTVRYHSTFWYARAREPIAVGEGGTLNCAPSADAVAGNGRPLNWAPSAHAVAGGRCGSWATRGSVSGWRR